MLEKLGEALWFSQRTGRPPTRRRTSNRCASCLVRGNSPSRAGNSCCKGRLQPSLRSDQRVSSPPARRRPGCAARCCRSWPRRDDRLGRRFLRNRRGELDRRGRRPYGRRLRELTGRYPFVNHGLSLSIGGPGRSIAEFLVRLRSSSTNTRCCHYSEHLSYCSDDGPLYDLMPIPFTETARTARRRPHRRGAGRAWAVASPWRTCRTTRRPAPR